MVAVGVATDAAGGAGAVAAAGGVVAVAAPAEACDGGALLSGAGGFSMASTVGWSSLSVDTTRGADLLSSMQSRDRYGQVWRLQSGLVPSRSLDGAWPVVSARIALLS